jgi:acyl carrier protein
MNELPLTQNGKLDRRGLPEPKLLVNQFIEPQTPRQRELAKIWQDVLAVERVGLEDNFFELGGDSLIAVRLANRLRDIAGEQASPALILRAPTIAQLAEQLQNTTARTGPSNTNRAYGEDLDRDSRNNELYACYASAFIT